MQRKILFLAQLFLLVSCVDDFDFNLKKEEPRLVIEGLVTNHSGPYFVRITKSTPGGLTLNNNSSHDHTDNSEPVDDAIVIISDDFNQIDTLKPYKFDVTDDNFYWGSTFNKGFYKTKRLVGIPGHTYTLKIQSGNKEYKASSLMPPVPKIDSLGYALKKSEIAGKSDYYVPLLYFKEPQDTVNYYLVQLSQDIYSRIYSSSLLWQFSVLSDNLLEPYVNGLNVSRGVTPRGIDFYPVYTEGDSIYVALSSLTKEAFDFYKVLLDQFDNDGGVYKPTPTTPLGNISNGALGFFRASAFSEKRAKIINKSN